MIVEAGGGFGKTMLLASWRRRSRVLTVSIPLSPLHNDPTSLGQLIIERFAAVIPAVADLVRGAGSSNPDWHRELLPALRQRLRGRQVIPMVDDIHHVTDPAALDLIAALADDRLASGVMVVSGRRVPRLPLQHRPGTTWRVRHTDLTWKASDVVAVAGGDMGANEAQQLVEATGGWPIAVQVILSARQRGAGSVESLRSSEFQIDLASYLEEEIFPTLDECVLTGAMAAATIAPTDASTLAAALPDVDLATCAAGAAASGLPMMSVEPDGTLRMHDLLKEVLRARMRRVDPAGRLEVVDRAVDHLAERGDERAAFLLVSSLNDPARASAFVSRWGAELIARGYARTVSGWLDELGPDAVLADPELILLRALLCASNIDFEGMLQWISQHAAGNGNDVEAQRRTRALLEFIGVLPRSDAAAAVSAEGGVFATLTQIIASLMLSAEGDFEESERLLAAAEAGSAGYPLLEILHASSLAVALVRLDRADEAAQRIAHSVELVESTGLSTHPLSLAVDISAAQAAAHTGDKATAGRLLLRARRKMADMTSERLALLRLCWLGILAETAFLIGDQRSAAALAADAFALTDQAIGGADAKERVAELRQMTGEPGQTVLTTAELGVVRYLDSFWAVPRIASELGISVATARSHVRSAYRKLDVHERAGAVQAARRLGLLG